MNIEYISKLLILLNLNGYGNITIKKLLNINKIKFIELNIEVFFDYLYENKLTSKIPSNIEIELLKEKVNRIIEHSIKENIQIISFDNNLYPKNLLSLNDYPIMIFVKGNSNILNYEKNIAVIGTREPTLYTKKHGYKYVEFCSNNDFVITSGLALGCDTIAHESAVNLNKHTIAVMAHGLDQIHPKTNVKLANQIIETGGCLISEYQILVGPKPYFFVARDRLQAALSNMIFVLETGIDGGSMHTVKFGYKLNKKIGCLMAHPVEYYHHDKLLGNKQIISEFGGIPIKNFNDLELILQNDFSKSILNDRQMELF